MDTEAATTATPDSTDNPEPFQELPDIYQNGVHIPRSYVYYQQRDAARRAANPQPENVAPALDDEEVFEFEQPAGLAGPPGVSPLDRRTTRTHTVSRHIQLARQSPRCTHVRASGVRCGSPAMRGEHYCYYHQHVHRGPRLIYPTLSRLEDAHGIQVALMEVLAGILDGRLEHKTGALLLYGLQTAVSNLKHMPAIDPDDMVTGDPESEDRDEASSDAEADAVAEKAAAADAVRSAWQQLGDRHHIPSRPSGDTAQDARFAETIASYYRYDPDDPGDHDHAGEGPSASLRTGACATKNAPAARYAGESPASTQVHESAESLVNST